MCRGVTYKFKGTKYRIHFTNPWAKLPVATKHNGLVLLPWGRRIKQAGELPLGGWASLDSIYTGQWDKYFPTPVKIMVDGFMEQDIEGASHWFMVTYGQWIQGLVARDHKEQRVYVVTTRPDFKDSEYDRWPRILAG
jgi:hypothetical protein